MLARNATEVVSFIDELFDQLTAGQCPPEPQSEPEPEPEPETELETEKKTAIC